MDVEYTVEGDHLLLNLKDPRANRKRTWRRIRSMGAPLELVPTVATVKAKVPREAVEELRNVLSMIDAELVPGNGEPALSTLEAEGPRYEDVRPVEPEDAVDDARQSNQPGRVLERALATLGTFAQENPGFAHRVERDKKYLRRAAERFVPDKEPEDDPDPVKQAVSRLLKDVPDEDTWRARGFLLELHDIAETYQDQRPTSDVPDPIPGFQGTLRGYQEDAVSFLLGNELTGILADEMGLGKTVTTIATVLAADERALVVAPANVLHNWVAEIRRFTGQTPALWHGQDVDENTEARFRITTYASLRYRDWRDTDADTRPILILDEAHKVRNPETQRSRLIKDLPQTQRILLTGTPIVNGLEDYNELLLHVGEDRWPDAATFRDTWMSDRELLTKHAEVRQATADLLQRATQHIVLRRRKDEVLEDLPPRTIQVEPHPLDEDQQEEYQTLYREAQSVMADADSEVEIFAQIHKLRQKLLEYRVPFLQTRIEELLEAGERVIVYAHYLDALDDLQDAFPNVSARIDGNTPPKKREQLAAALDEPEGPRVLLVQMQAGGVGLNFTGARWVLFSHLGWTAAVHRQAIDRVHRIGQDRPVNVEFFLTPNTIDERMVDLILKKEADANLALADEDEMLDQGEIARALLADDA